MNKTAIILAFILYVIIAIGNFRQRDYPHCFIWLCYAGSLIGFFWDAMIKDEMP